MSFCCGASMIGTKGTLKYNLTHIHNVPLLFCPVCHHVEVHYLVQQEYDILAEYAHNDGAYEVDFGDYMGSDDEEELTHNCVSHDFEEPLDVIKTQIDMALDLLTVAQQLDDAEWAAALKKRLAVLGQRRAKLEKRMIGK